MSASVRGIREAVGEAVSAVLAADLDRFEPAVQRLESQDQERLRIVQGTIVRELLEDLHPSGLSGADAQDVLQRCVRAAASWYPPVEPAVLVAVLMGALGAADPEDNPPAVRGAFAVHGSLLIADLLSAQAETGASIEQRLDHAFAEIERAETMEMP
ncbi:MAG: hypothetical protein M3Y42_20710 [Actinomycetota bacterium]|nr:hypothetical protein [Actinomycetota bacterium]MDQ2959369.1 hypothetical protein [Actinomycetota bacterium]